MKTTLGNRNDIGSISSPAPPPLPSPRLKYYVYREFRHRYRLLYPYNVCQFKFVMKETNCSAMTRVCVICVNRTIAERLLRASGEALALDSGSIPGRPIARVDDGESIRRLRTNIGHESVGCTLGNRKNDCHFPYHSRK